MLRIGRPDPLEAEVQLKKGHLMTVTDERYGSNTAAGSSSDNDNA